MLRAATLRRYGAFRAAPQWRQLAGARSREILAISMHDASFRDFLAPLHHSSFYSGRIPKHFL